MSARKTSASPIARDVSQRPPASSVPHKYGPLASPSAGRLWRPSSERLQAVVDEPRLCRGDRGLEVVGR